MKDIKYKATFMCETKINDWNCYKWLITINGESFEYHTGLGHATDVYKKSNGYSLRRNKKPENSITVNDKFLHVPQIEDVLECLISDMRYGEYSFNEFCDNLDYDNDSLKALDTYRACMTIGEKLVRVIGRAKINEIEESLQV